MKAMVLKEAGAPLHLEDRPAPKPGPGQVLVHVHACGVCRTDLHIRDGELTQPKLPLIPGHEVVGTVVEAGPCVEGVRVGERVGIPWLGRTCGRCKFCQTGLENLCNEAGFTGYTLDGGYAEYTLADHRYCFPIPAAYDHAEAAPLLCAGLIGYRAFRMTGEAHRIGLYGFGAAAHILAQVACHLGREVYAFTRPGDEEGQAFARSLGATWAGGSDETPPETLDAAILFAPVGALVPEALRVTARGGTVVCAGIHMSDIPAFPYRLLWGERTVRSVANLTRQDGERFFEIASEASVRTHVEKFPLEEANEALTRLREGQVEGAAVLVMGEREAF